MVGDVPLIYKENTENERFKLDYILDMGKDHNNKLPLMMGVKFLGTANTPLMKRKSFIN